MSDHDTPVVASRFADPAATTTIPLGPCRCPGTPHGEDSAQQRTEIGEGEIRSAYGTATRFREDGTAYFDEAAGDDAAIARFTKSWTLADVDAKGKPAPVPINVVTIALLDPATREALLAPVNALVARRAGRVPNGSGGPSEESSPGTASPAPKVSTRRSRTTRRSSPGEASDQTS